MLEGLLAGWRRPSLGPPLPLPAAFIAIADGDTKLDAIDDVTRNISKQIKD